MQFNDVKWDKYWDGSQWRSFTYQHSMADFDTLLSSRGTRFGVNSDADSVFGSFRDYFWENSRQRYSPAVQILNQTDQNGYPIWVELSGNKSSYGSWSFIYAADNAATSAGLDISTSTTVRLCYIYAGNWVSNIGVFATRVHGSRMVVPERYNRSHPQVDEDVNDRMTHIGYYAHEFGHLMGADHTSTSQHWSLMHTGHKAGTVLANRPASMNPWFLYKSGWANLIFLDRDTAGVDLVYNTSDTVLSAYYVREISASGERFLVENRQYENMYDRSLPGAVEGMSGGILIWNIVNDGLGLGETDLVEADNDAQEEMANMAQDVFRPDVYTDGMIGDLTTPANLRLRDGNFSKFAISGYVDTGNPITVNFLVDYDPPPSAPQNLQMTNWGQNGQHPNLTWDANAEPDLDHYAV